MHLMALAGALALLVYLRPAAIWWAVVFLCAGAVIAFELINTAIEKLADHLHPQMHPHIRIVKDCAAAAVLVLAVSALAVAVALVWS